MKNITEIRRVFTFDPNIESCSVRIEVIDGEPWFVAKDVCDAIDHSNHKMAVQQLDNDEVKKVYLTDSRGCEQETTVVSESGLYTLIMRSNYFALEAYRELLKIDSKTTRRRLASLIEYLLENITD
jgi:prophage antirepressor-like protein